MNSYATIASYEYDEANIMWHNSKNKAYYVVWQRQQGMAQSRLASRNQAPTTGPKQGGDCRLLTALLACLTAYSTAQEAADAHDERDTIASPVDKCLVSTMHVYEHDVHINKLQCTQGPVNPSHLQ